MNNQPTNRKVNYKPIKPQRKKRVAIDPTLYEQAKETGLKCHYRHCNNIYIPKTRANIYCCNSCSHKQSELLRSKYYKQQTTKRKIKKYECKNPICDNKVDYTKLFCTPTCAKRYQRNKTENKSFPLMTINKCKNCDKPFIKEYGMQKYCTKNCKRIQKNKRQLIYNEKKIQISKMSI